MRMNEVDRSDAQRFGSERRTPRGFPAQPSGGEESDSRKQERDDDRKNDRRRTEQRRACKQEHRSRHHSGQQNTKIEPVDGVEIAGKALQQFAIAKRANALRGHRGEKISAQRSQEPQCRIVRRDSLPIPRCRPEQCKEADSRAGPEEIEHQSGACRTGKTGGGDEPSRKRKQRDGGKQREQTRGEADQ